ncbi:MAG: cytochrome P450 [Anaerolineales bacterium]|nr:cytochrome P450 [Anaerolineales bacterium]
MSAQSTSKPQATAAQPVDLPGGNWLLGNVRQFNQDRTGMMVKAAQLGRVVHLRFLNEHAYLVSEPEDVKWVLVDNNRNYVKGHGTRALKPVLGDGLLTNEGESHLRQRRLIQPAFHRQRIAAYASIMAQQADLQMAQWGDGATFDLHEELMHLTMIIVAQSLFGVDVSQRADQLGQVITDLVYDFNFNRIGPVGQFIDRFDLARARRRKERLVVLDGMIYDMIRQRRAEGVDHGDLLSMLVQTQDTESSNAADAGMSDKQVRDEVLTLFLAGHETTAIAITWSFYLLSQDTAVQAQLRHELDSVLGAPGSPGARLPGWDDLPKLEYTHQVFSEALRIYPPAWATARLAVQDDEIAGCKIPAGAQVIVSPFVTQRDSRWWPDPMRFNPARFSPELEAGRPKFAYFPFGGGPRRCIGEPFARMEGVLLIAALAHPFQIEVQPGYVPELLPQVTLRPKEGMPVRVASRK